MSIVRKIFPDAGETDMFEKINQAQVHAGKFNVKSETAKTDLTTDKRRYTIDDVNSGIEVNKVNKVSIMDTGGYYIKIPRLIENNVTKEDLT